MCPQQVMNMNQFCLGWMSDQYGHSQLSLDPFAAKIDVHKVEWQDLNNGLTPLYMESCYRAQTLNLHRPGMNSNPPLTLLPSPTYILTHFIFLFKSLLFFES